MRVTLINTRKDHAITSLAPIFSLEEINEMTGLDITRNEYLRILHHYPDVKTKRWRPNFANAILAGSDFSGAYISGAYFRGADLTDVKFEKTTLVGCDFDDGVEEDLKNRGAIFETAEAEGAAQ